MNRDLAEIRGSYEQAIASLRGQLSEERASIEAFAQAHRADFGEVKSRDLVHGRVGWRLTPPAVKTLNRKWTFSTVVDVVMGVRRLAHWLRVKRELDKEAVLADYAANQVDDAGMAEVGLRVCQDEQFVLDLKLDAVQ